MKHLVAAVAVVLLAGCSAQPPTEPEPLVGPSGAGSSGAGSSSGGTTTSGSSVDVVVGHCWVEPVLFGGQRWAVPYRLNFAGAGGGFHRHYDDWQGSGEMRSVSADLAVYRDAGGSEVRFRPVSFLREREPARGCR